MNGTSQEQRVALITGGGTGIGKAISLDLARMGIAVAVNYSRSREDAEETVREAQASGARALAVQADVSQEDQVQAMVDRVMEEWGRLDIVVNNAGTTRFVPHPNLDGLTGEDWDRVMDINVKGTFFVSRAAARVMGEGGSIVNIASIAGISAKGSSIAYCASKAAMINLTVSMARVLAPRIRVNAVAPGYVETRWTAGHPEHREANLRITPMGRVAVPEDISEVAVALATGFRHVTGQVVVVDGGALIY